MTADDIKALVERLHAAAPLATNGHVLTEAADALETLTLENQRLRVDSEAMRQELKNIANADTVEWDDPTQYEAWAKSRARHTLGKIDKEKP
jgi:molybdenum cofactor biosynthesis enzyme MoaA